jgi:hypothetical protein
MEPPEKPDFVTRSYNPFPSDETSDGVDDALLSGEYTEEFAKIRELLKNKQPSDIPALLSQLEQQYPQVFSFYC